MKQTEPSSEYYGTYAPRFREQVHQILAWGYQDAIQRIKQTDGKDHQEPTITGFITSAIQSQLRAIIQPTRWLKYYLVKDDPPVDISGKSGRSRPRADIIIEATWRGRPEYYFEAKRLRRSGYGPSKYIGNDGMGCFVKGIYAQRYDEAAMIGYVQGDLPNDWQTKLKIEIQHSTNELELCSTPQDVAFPHSFPFEWQTKHTRQSIGRPITIYHILLDCVPLTS